MIVVLGDTHREADHGVSGTLLSRVREATAVVHTGDLVTIDVLESFAAEAGGTLTAVHGNADAPTVRDRLPARRTVTADGHRIAVVHGHEHSRTALSLLGREADADLVAFGHTHRPAVVDGSVTLCNPGSHTRPRGGPPTYAIIKGDQGRIHSIDGGIETEFGLG